MRKTALVAATGMIATPALAGEMTVSLEIPRLRVAEYHNPYVAIWIEDATGQTVANLDAWYDVKLPKGEGTKWLADMRTWWRRAGRSLQMPADGISGPTVGPGTHQLKFTDRARPLGKLAPGAYTLRIEAAREVGGREVVDVRFQWPPKGRTSVSATGSKELGKINLALKP